VFKVLRQKKKIIFFFISLFICNISFIFSKKMKFLSTLFFAAQAQISDVDKYLMANQKSGPVSIQMFFGSDCPYSQEFIPRHMPKVLNAVYLPIEVKMMANMRDLWDSTTKCEVTEEKKAAWKKDNNPFKRAPVACRANLATMCAWSGPDADLTDPAYRKKLAGFTLDLFSNMQQWTFQKKISNKGIGLVEEIGKKYFDWNKLTACMDGYYGDRLAQDALDQWAWSKAEIKKQFGSTMGIFPRVFIEGQALPVGKGQWYDVYAKSLPGVLCLERKDIPECNKLVSNMVGKMDVSIPQIVPEGASATTLFFAFVFIVTVSTALHFSVKRKHRAYNIAIEEDNECFLKHDVTVQENELTLLSDEEKGPIGPQAFIE